MDLHPDDVNALDFEIDRQDSADDVDFAVAERLGVDLYGPRALCAEIVNDMAVPVPDSNTPRDANGRAVASAALPLPAQSSFGIAWWSAHALGTRRRILIGDYLFETAHTLGVNLLEARLHWSSVRAHLARAGTWRPSTGTLYIQDALAQLHVAGMLRGVASAADCIGALTVGMAGLSSARARNHARKFRLQLADFGVLRTWQDDVLPTLVEGDAKDLQREAVASVMAAFDSHPGGWFDWARQYRNTFIHRGRRHQQWHEGFGLRLPRHPERSEMQSLILSTYPEGLAEPAESTLACVMERAQLAVTSACAALLGIWRARRASPQLIEQPAEQWPDLFPAANRTTTFDGFEQRPIPGTNAAIVSPAMHRRLLSGAVPWKARWDTLT